MWLKSSLVNLFVAGAEIDLFWEDLELTKRLQEDGFLILFLKEEKELNPGKKESLNSYPKQVMRNFYSTT